MSEEQPKSMSKAMTVKEPQQITAHSPTPADLVQIAINQNADLEKLEKLMDLQLKWEANQAKKAFVAAMAKFKQNPPDIFKDRHVKFKSSKGIVEYDHASLGNVVKLITAALAEHGLSISWDINQEKQIKVDCILTHHEGHSERISMLAPPDGSGLKNPIQQISSTIAYLQRYTILAITGLATMAGDDDARSAYSKPAEQPKQQGKQQGKKQEPTNTSQDESASQRATEPGHKAESPQEQEKRAQKALDKFKSYFGIIQADLEGYLSKELKDWEAYDLAKLLEAYNKIQNTPAEERKALMTEMFNLEPGALG